MAASTQIRKHPGKSQLKLLEENNISFLFLNNCMYFYIFTVQY